MKYSVFMLTLIFLAGCATTPETTTECNDLFTTEKEISKCKDRVDKRELIRSKKELLKQAEEDCISNGMVWWYNDRWRSHECISSAAARDRMEAIIRAVNSGGMLY